jgi:hypothetical protein
MNDNHFVVPDRDLCLENVAAELTSAVYPLILRNGPSDSWLKLELGLWKALAEIIDKWAWQRPPAASSAELAMWWDGLLGALTCAAQVVALNNGVWAVRSEVEFSLSEAFRRMGRRYNYVS